MRAYELMVIYDGDTDEAVVNENLAGITRQVEAGGGRVATTDRWGRRRFATRARGRKPPDQLRVVHPAAKLIVRRADTRIPARDFAPAYFVVQRETAHDL